MAYYSLFVIAWNNAVKNAIEKDTHFLRSIGDICRLQKDMQEGADRWSVASTKDMFSLLVYDRKYGNGLGRYSCNRMVEAGINPDDLVFTVPHEKMYLLMHESHEYVGRVFEAFARAGSPEKRRTIAQQRAPVVIPLYLNDTNGHQVLEIYRDKCRSRGDETMRWDFDGTTRNYNLVPV